MFIKKHPGSFHSHSTINIPNRLSEDAGSLLRGVSLCHFLSHILILISRYNFLMFNLYLIKFFLAINIRYALAHTCIIIKHDKLCYL